MSTKVLVLENTEGISEILNISLATDYDVITAVNGEEALSLIDKNAPPLLICDVNVPDMDGIEFLCKVKKQYPSTEVIIITDIENREIGVRSLKYEASDFIVKPVTSSSLEIVLERARKKLAIKKKLTPSTGDHSSDQPDPDRVSLVKQIINSLSASSPIDATYESNTISGIIAIHSNNGIIIEASDEYKKIIGDMVGKKSCEVYKGDSSNPETCPASMAFNNETNHRQKAVLCLKNGDEVTVDVFTAPIINSDDVFDLVVEIINI